MYEYLPERFRNAAERLSETEEQEALDDLVAAFGPCGAGSGVHRQLGWLTYFAVRRALPCWDLYSDGDYPHKALEAVRSWLAHGERTEKGLAHANAVEPTYRGRRIIDCTYSDTMAVSESVAALARFCESGDPAVAREALHSAEDAFRFSPLWQQDQFRQWLACVALPASLEPRDLTADEQVAHRDYDAGEIAQEKERGGMRPLTEQGIFQEFLHVILAFLFPYRRQSTPGKGSNGR